MIFLMMCLIEIMIKLWKEPRFPCYLIDKTYPPIKLESQHKFKIIKSKISFLFLFER